MQIFKNKTDLFDVCQQGIHRILHPFPLEGQGVAPSLQARESLCGFL